MLNGKDPTPFFEKWRGAQAKIWDYTVSHNVLTIRLNFTEKRGSLYIYCGDTDFIQGPTIWANSCLEIVKTEAGRCTLKDRVAGIEIRAGVVGVEEDTETTS